MWLLIVFYGCTLANSVSWPFEEQTRKKVLRETCDLLMSLAISTPAIEKTKKRKPVFGIVFYGGIPANPSGEVA
jgi:hypothetical protein